MLMRGAYMVLGQPPKIWGWAEGQRRANQREPVETDMDYIQISPSSSRTNHNAI